MRSPSYDIYTDKGSYRFDVNGLLIGRGIGEPRADIKQLTQLEDAKIEAQEKAIIGARKAMQKGDMTDPLLKNIQSLLNAGVWTSSAKVDFRSQC